MSPAPSGDFLHLVAELRALPVPDSTRTALVELFRRFNGVRIDAFKLAQSERVDVAARLLVAGNARTLVRDRLRAIFKVSKRTADRDISKALDHRRPARPVGGSTAR